MTERELLDSESDGIALLDYLAAKAMAALLYRNGPYGEDQEPKCREDVFTVDELSEYAYAQAAAMMTAREEWKRRLSKQARPTCSTCKHRDAGGYCNSDKLQEDWGNCTEDQKSDMLLYSFMESGRFWTGPNFGCIHHAEKGLTTLTATPHKA